MPTYDYLCPACGWHGERVSTVADRHEQKCAQCSTVLTLQPAAPMFRFAGRIPQGGGPDRFTADMLGIPLKDLPKDMKA